MVMHLEAMGIQVKYHHHEVGGPGQAEIETPMMGMVRAGDATMVVKYVTKMTAYARGQSATFMPKPLYGEAGSGCTSTSSYSKAARMFSTTRMGTVT
jgi:glutamine synthetase